MIKTLRGEGEGKGGKEERGGREERRGKGREGEGDVKREL